MPMPSGGCDSRLLSGHCEATASWRAFASVRSGRHGSIDLAAEKRSSGHPACAQMKTEACLSILTIL